MKLGVVGKGGVGKTTVSALLARAWVERGSRVLAVDADSDPSLGLSLGLSPEEVDALPVLSGSAVPGTGASGTTARSLLQDYGVVTPAGVTLLQAGRVEHAGGGSMCPANAAVRSLLEEALGEFADVTVVDMQAGHEHLSRVGGTLAAADVALVVMEPNRTSLIAAARTLSLARDLGIPQVYGLGNKAQLPDDERFFSEEADAHDVPLAGVLPLDRQVADAGRSALLAPSSAELRQRLEGVIDRLEWITARPGRASGPAAGPAHRRTRPW